MGEHFQFVQTLHVIGQFKPFIVAMMQLIYSIAAYLSRIFNQDNLVCSHVIKLNFVRDDCSAVRHWINIVQFGQRQLVWYRN